MGKKRTSNKKKLTVDAKKTGSKKSKFFQAAWDIITNKKDTEKKFTNAALSLMISLFLNLITFFLALSAICGVIVGIRAVVSARTLSFSIVMRGILFVLVIIMLLLFALVLRGMANEVEREKDSNYLVSLFSGLSGFMALIVALIALSKGVG